MTSLVDIAKRRVTVLIQGADIEVYGVSAEGLVSLIERFPKIRELIFPTPAQPVPPVSREEAAARLEAAVARREAGVEAEALTVVVREPTDLPDTLRAFPEALAAILAAGTGHPGEAEHEAAARSLGADDQLTLLDKIMELTMPNGITAFLERLTGLLGADVSRQAQRSGNEQPPSPSAPNGKAPDMQSPTA